jgi:electron transport complex protein RnfG
MVNMLKMIIALAIISALAGLAIGAAYDKTAEKIAEQGEQAKQEAIKGVFPQGVVIKEETGSGTLPDSIKYWSATAGSRRIGYAFEVKGKGYAGDIRFMVGADSTGKILGLTVLSHNETPGLGSRISEIASTKYVWYPVGDDGPAKPWFTQQFEGLSSLKPIGINKKSGEWHNLDEQKRADLKNKNEVTAITGSTVSTKAFTNSISQVVGGYVKALRN